MTKRPPVTIVLGEFEDIAARGLTSLIDDDANLDLVAAGVNPSQLTAALDAHIPDVAILNFGSLVSAAEIREMHAQFPRTRLLVIANRPTPAESQQLLAFGATGCLSKNSEARDILHAIHLASRGLHLLPPGHSAATSPAPPGPELLTPRESDVLEHLRAGDSNAEIAAALHVGIETVRTHARRVYRKLGVKTRRELVQRR